MAGVKHQKPPWLTEPSLFSPWHHWVVLILRRAAITLEDFFNSTFDTVW